MALRDHDLSVTFDLHVKLLPRDDHPETVGSGRLVSAEKLSGNPFAVLEISYLSEGESSLTSMESFEDLAKVSDVVLALLSSTEYDIDEEVEFDSRTLKFVGARDPSPSCIFDKNPRGFLLSRANAVEWKFFAFEATRIHILMHLAETVFPMSLAGAPLSRVHNQAVIDLVSQVFAVQLSRVELSPTRQTEIIARLWK
jgi:hypothetical protein